MTRSDPGPRPVFGVVFGHGDLPRALAEAAADIVGDRDGLAPVSNLGLDSGRMDEELATAIAAHPGEDLIIFVDMAGSSCSRSGNRACADRPGIAVVTGVNLPMLVRFLAYRSRTALPELVELMLRTGRDSIGPG
jgi:PTS system mannose-specific IIA component